VVVVVAVAVVEGDEGRVGRHAAPILWASSAAGVDEVEVALQHPHLPVERLGVAVAHIGIEAGGPGRRHR
jgi:hypothetical protein